jgi:DNA helicase-4
MTTQENETEADIAIDALIRTWSVWDSYETFYIDELVPSIITEYPNNERLTAAERVLVARIKELLTKEQWLNLTALVRARIDYERNRIVREEQQRIEVLNLLNEFKEFFKHSESHLEDRYVETVKILQDFVDRKVAKQVEIDVLISNFVQGWAKKQLGINLDLQQALSVGKLGGDIRVTARAGSGKTTTLVTRAIFLIQHCKFEPKSLLLLAFNKNAAAEMQKRIEAQLGDQSPYVMTFHALAYGLVHPTEAIMMDDTNAKTLSRFVTEIVDQKIRHPITFLRIRSFMMQYFRDEWDARIQSGHNLEKDEFLKMKRKQPSETLNGEYAKSYGERLIANTLLENDIEYKYERNFFMHGSPYHPDFAINLPKGGGIILEYFGMTGDKDYDKSSEEKRAFWQKQQNWKLIERNQWDIHPGDNESFCSGLIEELNALGVKSRKLSEDEIWRRVSKRALTHFDKLSKSFIARARKAQLSAEGLKDLIGEYQSSSEVERKFLEIQLSIYSTYLDELNKSQVDDFDGLMQRSIGLVNSGSTVFSRIKGTQVGDLSDLRFIMIDEFQDFTPMFYDLVIGIRQMSDDLEFFCVGDDWQAINSFAGSDLAYFEQFQNYFQQIKHLEISTNYRSPKSVVKLGNGIMRGKGTPAIPHQSQNGSIGLIDIQKSQISGMEMEEHGGDVITPALIRILEVELQQNIRRNVVLLCRENRVPYYVQYKESMVTTAQGLEKFLEHLKSFISKEDSARLSISTAHGYKGLENDAVIILDAIERSYPLIHSDWKFTQIFGSSVQQIVEEERRLFYVAATRSKELIYMITESDQPSEFLADLEDLPEMERLSLSDFPAISRVKTDHYVIQVFDSYSVKEDLKKDGYRWDSTTKYWYKQVQKSLFSIEEIQLKIWNNGKVRIKVYSGDLELIWESHPTN